MNPEFLHLEPPACLVRFHVGIYGAEPIAKAAHKFTDRCFVHLEHESAESILCRLAPKSTAADIRALAGELANEVLDQMLRARLSAETEPTRRLLLAQAFSRTNILKPELDEQDPAADRLRISAPDAPRAP